MVSKCLLRNPATYDEIVKIGLITPTYFTTSPNDVVPHVSQALAFNNSPPLK